jgi:EAL domain-containing protein (putative c-di-GMP-specific phosphodiesterase class I)
VTVTAEGIERPGQLEWLRSRGCNEVQGFLLSEPLVPAELEQRFLSKSVAPAPEDALLREARRAR